MLESKEGKRAHKTGANAVSWAPPALGLRLVTGGCDNRIKIWACQEDGMTWKEEAELGVYNSRSVHTDWVRDVAWAPSPLPGNLIASCGEDAKCYVYSQDAETGEWTAKALGEGFSSPVWRVSWSVSGNVLAVASGDHKVSLWKESLEQGGAVWRSISNVAEDGSLAQA